MVAQGWACPSPARWLNAWVARCTPPVKRPAAPASPPLEIPLELHQPVEHSQRPELEPEATCAPGRKILLVEDNQVNQTVIEAMLSSLGYEVSMVSDGAQAIHFANTERFAAILMDCRLPIINGYEATRQIRQLPGCMTLPIIALTANALQGDRETCLQAGMNDSPSRSNELIWSKSAALGPVTYG